MLLRLSILLALLCSFHAHALQVPNPMQHGIQLDKTGALAYFRDASGQASLEEIIRQDQAGAFSPMPLGWIAGYSKDAFWFKFTLDFPDIPNNKYWLEIFPAILDDVSLYVPDAKNHYSKLQLGDHFSVEARPIQYRNFLFPLYPDASSGAQTYYVRVQSTSVINFHATLWQPHVFISGQSQPDSLTGAYYGVRLFLALLALILWIWLRNEVFILYSIYQCVSCITQAYLAGTAQISLPLAPLASDAIQKSTNFLFMATVLIFYVSLFQLKKHLPRLFRLTKIIVGLELAIFLGIGIQLLPFNGLMTNLFLMVNLSILLYASVWLLLHRHFDRLLYILSFWLGFGLYILVMLHNLNISIGPPITMMDMPIFWPLISLTLVTLGLINVAKQDAEKKLHAKEKALELSQEHKRILDQRVQDRTFQLERANHKLHHEVQERQALQAKLEDSLEKQNELMQAQREFFAMASHEFRTPLAIIDTTSQRLSLLQSQPNLDMGVLAPALRKIRRASQRMSRMIDNFLSMDRLETGNTRQNIRHETLNLGELARVMVEHYLNFSDRRIVLELSPTSAMIHGDQYLINLVISNLIDNALKYSTPETDITVRVFHDQHECHLEVRNTGPGIPQELHERIFEKYVRLEDSSAIHGTGLGLHIARRILESHDGKLTVHSNEQATCFRLTLPRAAT
ncbi:sensor histidine kinase [Methylobacillus sp.]|uniref:sensor histidine kinase n=1 Tax=Methylobacillus sp. TaxID=56818 RepID=UPI002FE26C0D